MTNPLANLDRAQNQAISEARLKTKISTLSPKQQQFVNNTVPVSQQRVYADAYEGKSNTKAIKAKCLDCCNNSKEDITLCAVEICPLWSVRPYRTKRSEKEEDQDLD